MVLFAIQFLRIFLGERRNKINQAAVCTFPEFKYLIVERQLRIKTRLCLLVVTSDTGWHQEVLAMNGGIYFLLRSLRYNA